MLKNKHRVKDLWEEMLCKKDQMMHDNIHEEQVVIQIIEVSIEEENPIVEWEEEEDPIEEWKEEILEAEVNNNKEGEDEAEVEVLVEVFRVEEEEDLDEVEEVIWEAVVL